MDEQNVNQQEQNPQPEEAVYTPRPMWQVWAARVGLVIMIIAVILYYLHIAKGGLL